MGEADTLGCEAVEVRGVYLFGAVAAQIVGQVFPDEPEDVWPGGGRRAGAHREGGTGHQEPGQSSHGRVAHQASSQPLR